MRAPRAPSLLAERLSGVAVPTLVKRALAQLRDEPLFEALSKTDQEEVARIVRRELKEKAAAKAVSQLVKDTLEKFARTMYNRRSFWLSEL